MANFFGIYPLTPRSVGSGFVSFDSDVTAYFNNIVSNGGTISESSMGSVNTFVLSLKATGLWNNLVEIYPFMGNQLAAALTKLKYLNTPYCINNNFINSDYTETGPGAGIKGDASTKYLNTQLPMNNGLQLSTSASQGAYKTAILDAGIQPEYPIGVTFPSGWLVGSDFGVEAAEAASASVMGSSVILPGLISETVGGVGGNTLTLLENATNTGTTTGATYPASVTVSSYICAVTFLGGAAAFFTANPIGFAFNGLYLTDAQIATFYALIQELQTSLGRQA